MVYKSLTGFQMAQWLRFSILDGVRKAFLGDGLDFISHLDLWLLMQRDRTKWNKAVCFNTVCHYREFTFILSHNFYFCAVQNSRTYCQRKSRPQYNQAGCKPEWYRKFQLQKKANAFPCKGPVYILDSKEL